jgi:abortive infection bacteriophage resistance protein
MKKPFNKPPLSFEQQIDRIIERGLVCPDRPRVRRYLAHINYYRLTAYFLPFEADHATHAFRPGTRFDDVLNLYVFDRELRLLTLDAIERIEVSVRTGWAYTLAHRHGAHAHLDETLFSSKRKRWDYGQQKQKLIDETQKSQETFAKHFRERYVEPLPPVWAVAEVMTLGELSKWYRHLKSGADRNAVAHRYDMDEIALASFLHHLSTVRNLCAHHARLWNREFTFAFKLPRRPEILAESLNQKSRRIYNTLSVMTWIMDCISARHHWKLRLKELLARHAVDMHAMGFPQRWEALPVWRDEGKNNGSELLGFDAVLKKEKQ